MVRVMQTPDISKSEWAVMEVLWEGPPRTASEVAKILRPTTNWAENTVRTLLMRLVENGALKTGVNSNGTKTFIPAVERDACVLAEGESFIQRMFRGAAKPLLIHFATNAKLSPADVRELKKLLDQSTTR